MKWLILLAILLCGCNRHEPSLYEEFTPAIGAKRDDVLKFLGQPDSTELITEKLGGDSYRVKRVDKFGPFRVSGRTEHELTITYGIHNSVLVTGYSRNSR